MTETRDADALLVRPKPVVRRASLLTALFAGVPVLGVLYWLSIPRGTWPYVIVLQAVATAIFMTAYWRYDGVFIQVTRESIQERGFFTGRTSVPLDRVHSVVLANVYQESSLETLPQLIVLDADGRRLLRMRGTYWLEPDIQAVIKAIDRPVTTIPAPLTAPAFFNLYPGGAYWFENRPAIPVIGVILALALVLVAMAGLMALLGLPLGGIA